MQSLFWSMLISIVMRNSFAMPNIGIWPKVGSVLDQHLQDSAHLSSHQVGYILVRSVSPIRFFKNIFLFLVNIAKTVKIIFCWDGVRLNCLPQSHCMTCRSLASRVTVSRLSECVLQTAWVTPAHTGGGLAWTIPQDVDPIGVPPSGSFVNYWRSHSEKALWNEASNARHRTHGDAAKLGLHRAPSSCHLTWPVRQLAITTSTVYGRWTYFWHHGAFVS